MEMRGTRDSNPVGFLSMRRSNGFGEPANRDRSWDSGRSSVRRTSPFASPEPLPQGTFASPEPLPLMSPGPLPRDAGGFPPAFGVSAGPLPRSVSERMFVCPSDLSLRDVS
jgi:hypothetical protein